MKIINRVMTYDYKKTPAQSTPMHHINKEIKIRGSFLFAKSGIHLFNLMHSPNVLPEAAVLPCSVYTMRTLEGFLAGMNHVVAPEVVLVREFLGTDRAKVRRPAVTDINHSQSQSVERNDVGVNASTAVAFCSVTSKDLMTIVSGVESIRCELVFEEW